MPNYPTIYLPVIIVVAIIVSFAIIFIAAFAAMKNKKEAIGFDRNMKDGEIAKRLIRYAKPHWRSFALVLGIMVVSVVYDVVAPWLVGRIQGVLKGEFEMNYLLTLVAVYGSMLAVSMGRCSSSRRR